MKRIISSSKQTPELALGIHVSSKKQGLTSYISPIRNPPLLSIGKSVQILERSGLAINRITLPFRSLLRKSPGLPETRIHSRRSLPL